MNKKLVTVIVEGGVIQNITVPKGVTVIVRDYDIEGYEGEDLLIDDNGEDYIESRYEES